MVFLTETNYILRILIQSDTAASSIKTSTHYAIAVKN